MKLLLSSILVLTVVLMIGVSQADAFEGSIEIETDNQRYEIGDLVGLIGSIKGDPNADEKVMMVITNSETGDVIESITLKIENDKTFRYVVDSSASKWKVWGFYDVKVIYDDKNAYADFDLMPTPEMEALEFASSKMTPIEESKDMQLTKNTVAEKKIPGWVDVIFEAYIGQQISESELVGAIQFLAKSGIIEITSTAEESHESKWEEKYHDAEARRVAQSQKDMKAHEKLYNELKEKHEKSYTELEERHEKRIKDMKIGTNTEEQEYIDLIHKMDKENYDLKIQFGDFKFKIFELQTKIVELEDELKSNN